MKNLKKIIIVLIILIFLLFVAVTIFIATFDVNRFKPQIIKQASTALNRDIDFEKAKLGFSLTSGIKLAVNNIKIYEDPAFGKGEFLTVKKVSLGVDILGYILRKQISVSSIIVSSPHINIIRNKDGSLNVQTLSMAATGQNAAPNQTKAQVPLALPAIFVSSLKIENGSIAFFDYSFEPRISLKISQLGFSANKISLENSFPFSADAAVFSNEKNIRLNGRLRFDLKTNEVVISDLKGISDLSKIDFLIIVDSLPMLKNAVLPKELKGNVNLAVKKFKIGPKGLSDLMANITLREGVLKLNELALPVKDIAADMAITDNKITIDKISAAIGSGNIKGSGAIDDYLSRQNFKLQFDAQNLRLQEFVAQDKSQVKVEGELLAKAKINGSGLNPQILNSVFYGEADLSISKLKLININVLRMVLDNVSIIPGLSEKIQAGLPERFKQKLTQKDTVISDIKLPVAIENSRLVIKDAIITADEFIFKGQGTAGFDGSFSVGGNFLIPAELSQAFVNAVPQLLYLQDEEKQIFMPLKVMGKGTQIELNVDVEYLAQKLMNTQVKQQLFKVIEKAIGANEYQPKGQSATEQTEGQSGSTVEEAIGGLFDQILKK